ncbi:MAG: 2-oxoisovalerate dehydrogenase [Phycisphaerae bacterium]
MTEIALRVTENPDGGPTARALGRSVFIEAQTVEGLRRNTRYAVICHFDKPENRSKVVRLLFTKDEVMAL